MTKLKDYLAALSSEVIQARVSADLKTKEIALAYQNDDLLRSFPIPYFRTPEVEMLIPVALNGLTGGGGGTPVTDPKDLADLVIKTTDAYYKATLAGTERTAYYDYCVSILTEMLDAIKNRPAEEPNLIKEASLRLSKMSYVHYRAISQVPLVDATLSAQISDTITNALHPSAAGGNLYETDVISNSADLQNVDPKSIITIKFKVLENGMQWTKEEAADGTIVDKLIPE